MRYLVFIIGTAVSYLLLRYRGKVKDFVGDIGWAEKVFGVGGTHTFIIIFALLVFFGALLYAAGTLQDIVRNTLGRFFF